MHGAFSVWSCWCILSINGDLLKSVNTLNMSFPLYTDTERAFSGIRSDSESSADISHTISFCTASWSRVKQIIKFGIGSTYSTSGLETRNVCTRIFTAQCVCIARTMLSQDVSPSVRLSVRHTPELCRNGFSISSNFSLSAPHHSSFSIQNLRAIFRQGVWKNAILDQYLPLSRKWCKIGQQLL